MYAYITGTQTIKVVTKSVKTSCNIRKSLAPMHSTPAKCSNNSSADKNDEEFVDDPSFHNSKESFDTTTDMEVEGEPKEPIEEHFIVSKSCLWKLLGVCPKCCNACSIDIANRNGTFISVDRKCCQCEHNSRWDSQQFVKNQPVGNIILAAGIHFNGASPTKVLRVLETMRIPSPCYTSYWKLQTTLLQPTVYNAWQKSQIGTFELLRAIDGPLEVAGDSRSDSPGHCAKFGTYTIFETRIKKIIDFQLVQV